MEYINPTGITMELTELQAFVSVAEAGSFSDAAEQLFITQPAVSKRVAALESELDTKLFDRISRTVSLTEAGRALLPRARTILLEVEDSRRALSTLTDHIGGKLSLGTSHHIGLHRLPPVLREYNRNYPQVELDLHFMDSEQACEAVEHGSLELGIVTLPLVPPERLTTMLIWDDPMSVVVATDHALCKQQKISIQTLADYPAILPAHGTYTRAILERAIQPFGKPLNIGMSTNYLETIKMMVSIGLGWSVLPNTLIDEDLTPLKVKELKLTRELGLVHHQDRTRSNAASALIELLRKAK